MEEAVAMGAAAVALNASYARAGKASTRGGGKRAQQMAAVGGLYKVNPVVTHSFKA
jgi:hypothetical protein